MYAGDHVHGPEDALFTLVEYGDYECPDCGRLFRDLRRYQSELSTRLRLVFRHYPYSGIHKHAQMAAEAAEAADVQGKFWQMHDLLFENQNALEFKDLVNYASRLSMDVDQFRQALKAQTYSEIVRLNFIRGVQDGVNSTPGLFLNGVRQSGAFNEQNLKAMLDVPLLKSDS